MEVRLRGELPSRFSLPEKNDRHKNRLTNRDSSHFSKVLFPPNVNRPSPVILFGQWGQSSVVLRPIKQKIHFDYGNESKLFCQYITIVYFVLEILKISRINQWTQKGLQSSLLMFLHSLIRVIAFVHISLFWKSCVSTHSAKHPWLTRLACSFTYNRILSLMFIETVGQTTNVPRKRKQTALKVCSYKYKVQCIPDVFFHSSQIEIDVNFPVPHAKSGQFPTLQQIFSSASLRTTHTFTFNPHTLLIAHVSTLQTTHGRINLSAKKS